MTESPNLMPTITDLLGDIYTDAGVCIWLASSNSNLGGHTPADFITNGEAERVLREARRISDRPEPPSQPVPSGAAGPSDELVEQTAQRLRGEDGWQYAAEQYRDYWRGVAHAHLAEAQGSDGGGEAATTRLRAQRNEQADMRLQLEGERDTLRTALRAMARRSAQRRRMVRGQWREICELKAEAVSYELDQEACCRGIQEARAERDRARAIIARARAAATADLAVGDAFDAVLEALAEVAGRTEGGE